MGPVRVDSVGEGAQPGQHSPGEAVSWDARAKGNLAQVRDRSHQHMGEHWAPAVGTPILLSQLYLLVIPKSTPMGKSGGISWPQAVCEG